MRRTLHTEVASIFGYNICSYQEKEASMWRLAGAASSKGASARVAGASELRPGDHETFVQTELLQEPLCGQSRPHFFKGVATVSCSACLPILLQRLQIYSFTMVIADYSWVMRIGKNSNILLSEDSSYCKLSCNRFCSYVVAAWLRQGFICEHKSVKISDWLKLRASQAGFEEQERYGLHLFCRLSQSCST